VRTSLWPWYPLPLMSHSVTHSSTPSLNLTADVVYGRSLRETSTHTPLPTPLKNGTRLLYCILKIARHLYCVLKKAGQKKSEKRQKKDSKKGCNIGGKKMWQERCENSLFPSRSCCCLETSLKPVLFNDRNRSHFINVSEIKQKRRFSNKHPMKSLFKY